MASSPTPLKIGLTGGIGSGKSTVASMLVTLGATLIDTDAIARALTLPGGEAIEPLRRVFGDGAITPDGSLDRGAMRERVFIDPQARSRLEGILHPLIHAEAVRQGDAVRGSVAVFDVPLMTESQRWRALVDRVLVVDCRVETQIERVAARAGWTREAAQRVVSAQASRALRRSIADAVIWNDDTDLSGLQAHTETLWALWNNSRPTP